MNGSRTALRILICAGLLTTGACARNTLDEAPEQLLGTWVTPAPAYEDRAFTIEPLQITLVRGEAGPVTHRVERIEFQRFGGVTQYRFQYRNESGATDVFQVDHTPFPGDFLRIKNRPQIAWHRDTIGVAGL